MPPKKRAHVGRKTIDAKRKAIKRKRESLDERVSRIEDLRQREFATRVNEPPEKRAARLSERRDREAISRAQETCDERAARLLEKRVSVSTARLNETVENRTSRLLAQRVRVTQSNKKQAQENLKESAFEYNHNLNYYEHPNICIGKMEFICPHCCALKFKNETPGLCCLNGKIKLTPLLSPPDPLKSLMTGETATSKHFLLNIRKYNSCFQMTSFGTTREVREQGFMPTFKVQGQIYHKIGSLLPVSEDPHRFLQIFFMGDTTSEAESRCSIFPDMQEKIILDLQELLHQENAYVKLFKMALENMPNDECKVVIRADKTPCGEHKGRYNAPTFDEVAIVMVGNEFEKRDIVLQKRTNTLQRVVETHRSYDALQYPLIFWKGDDGYHFQIQQTNPTTGSHNVNKKVSAMNFYAYRIMVRAGETNHILSCRQLFHQFIVDMYVKIETERLLYIRLNQKKLRAEEYIHLKDAVNQDANPNDLGQMVILPSTVTGSPRQMHEYAQDAMTYVRQYGRPDLFITITCNPNWREIKASLFPNQAPRDRHDVIARVFKLKVMKLIEVISKAQMFGETQCWMYSIEWQKRGLPHAHMLIWLKNKIRATEIDKIICAELPDPEFDPVLFGLVTKHMVHGPCGNMNKSSPCMKEGKCSKRYPRELTHETQAGNDGYPRYRRRAPGDGGHTAKFRMRIANTTQEIEIDNKWVVPFCPVLIRMFQTHINVEWCHSIKSIKYICKYVTKGSDQVVFQIQEGSRVVVDEIEAFQLGRYISSNEAVWRILGFPIHQRYPTVVHLSVHLENGQRVYFTEHNLQQKLLAPPNTTLTSFFKLCTNDEFAQTLLYAEIPKYYVWDASAKIWKRRKQGQAVEGQLDVKSCDALGRVYTVHPSNAECFYLRMLLHVIRGPTSFHDLKKVDGKSFKTFREACQERGMLENDAHWNTTLEEAATTQSPGRLRHLFAILLTTCAVSNPGELWNNHKQSMSEDKLRDLQRHNPELNIAFTEEISNMALCAIEDLCLSMSGKHLQLLGMPVPVRDQAAERHCNEVLRETSYDVDELAKYVEKHEPLLTDDQRAAYNNIISQIGSNTGGIYFLDAPGGTGKTFILNLLLAKIRQARQIAVAVASSGIAATILHGGRTAHSTFKIPINVAHDEFPMCGIVKGSGHATVLQKCSLFIWDECTMAHKRALEALDRTLQDLRGSSTIMGGVVVVLAGDFRQTLPVIPRSTPADELNACLKASHLWNCVTKLALKTNMRVQLSGDISAGLFSRQLLMLGNGEIIADSETGLIDFPSKFCNIVNSISELKQKVFPNIQSNYSNHTWLCERAILAPRNDSVTKYNLEIQHLLPGEYHTYTSIDTVVDPAQAVMYPVEFLNSLEPAGFPAHKLKLKIGAPIMLLRNLDPPRLCNGTRLSIKKLYNNLIEATILTGCARGEDYFLPRIPLIPSDLPFDFRRVQFPVRLAFAMSINKSQGQSLKVAGINLENPCFSHGQLYVACSRVGSPQNLYVFTPNGKRTKNVVYAKALG